MGALRSRIAIYPIAFALGFVVLLVVVSGVSPFAAARTLVVTAAIATALVILGTVLLGDKDRGGVFGALAILAVMGGDIRLTIVILIAFVLLLLERYAIPADRQTIRWSKIGLIASRLVVILLLAIGIQAIQLGAPAWAWRAVTHETALQPGPSPVLDPSDPDIYVVLLDGHTRLDVGADLLDIHPAPLRDGLGQRGFTIADRSRSNYTLTAETLSSMLEQDHLMDIPRMAGLVAGTESLPAGAVVRDVVNDNVTLEMLRSRGYEIEASSSGFEEVSIREADRFIDPGQINEFEIGMLRRSVLGEVLSAVAPDAASAQQRDRIRGVLDVLASAPARATDRPTFHFAHVPSPHAPWVFRADGSPRTVADLEAFYAETSGPTKLDHDELVAGYKDQVVDIDRRLLETLDRLDAGIAERGRPAVTIVFSDHGSWIGAQEGDIRLRFKNLLAVRGTDVDVDVDPDATLVNVMPTLFGQLFGTAVQPRADTTYRYDARDVFDLVRVDDPDARSSP
jgi:hypothetical protein